MAAVAPAPVLSAPAGGTRRLRVIFGLSGASSAWYGPWIALILVSLGLSPLLIGVVLAITAAFAVLANSVWSDIADNRIGTVRAIRMVYLAAALAAGGGAVVHAIPAVSALAVVVVGVAIAPGIGLLDTLALHRVPPRDYGSVRLCASAGWAVTVWIDGAILQAVGLWLAFVGYAAGLGLMAYVARGFTAEPPPGNASSLSPLRRARAACHIEPALVPFLAGMGLISTATYAAWNFVPLTIASPFLLGVAVGVAALGEVPVMFLAGRITDRIGLRSTFALGTALYALQMVLWAVIGDPGVASVVLMFRGIALGATYVSTVRIAGQMLPTEMQNTAQLLMQMVSGGAGPIAGGLLGGLLYATLGAPLMFAVCAVATLAGTFFVWRAVARRELGVAAVPAAATA